MNKKNLAAEKNFLQALENHKKNNIQSAENYYKEALKLNIPIEKTWSCYKGGKAPCGKCDSCRIRDKALKEIGREDLCSQNI